MNVPRFLDLIPEQRPACIDRLGLLDDQHGTLVISVWFLGKRWMGTLSGRVIDQNGGRAGGQWQRRQQEQDNQRPAGGWQ